MVSWLVVGKSVENVQTKISTGAYCALALVLIMAIITGME
jgi:hypothetical protein